MSYVFMLNGALKNKAKHPVHKEGLGKKKSENKSGYDSNPTAHRLKDSIRNKLVVALDHC